jgi:hypothetical protein
MPVASKIGPVSNGQGVLIPESLQIAVAFYFANRETAVPCLYRGKYNNGRKARATVTPFDVRQRCMRFPIRTCRKQLMLIQRSKLDRMLTKSMTLTIAEEEALEEWCLHMHRDIRYGLASYEVWCAIVEDRGGILNARRPFYVNAELMTAVQRLDTSNLDFIGKNWYKRFVSRHLVLSAMY